MDCTIVVIARDVYVMMYAGSMMRCILGKKWVIDVTIEGYLDKAIDSWRDKRDKAFKKHGLNVVDIYQNGSFDKLPFDCLLPVCYVDAFNSVKASLDTLDNYCKKEGDV